MAIAVGAFLVGVPGAIVACDRPADGGAAASNDALIGGDVAAEAVASAMVHVAGCTATRVGEREILLAAHCVVDQYEAVIKPSLAPGSETLLFAASDLHGAAIDFDGGGLERLMSLARKVTVDEVIVHPSYLAELASTPIVGRVLATRFVAQATAADVAILRVASLDASVATRAVASYLPASGERVTLTGVGCETANDEKPTRFAFKVGASRVLDAAAIPGLVAVHDAGIRERVLGADPICVPGSCIFFPGILTGKLDDLAGASDICSGDSGGPVLAARGDKLAIVALNHAGRFIAKDDPRLLYGAGARLDDSSDHHVGRWLRDQGVAVEAW